MDFNTFVTTYGKAYVSNSTEYAERLAVFTENAALVERLNADVHDTAVYELNAFADLTAEEFAAGRLLANAEPAPEFPAERYSLDAVDDVELADDGFDWRDKGAVTDVRDQGSLGTCWIFSTAQNLEGQLFLSGGSLEDLSVEQVLECDANSDKTNGHADCGMFGGWPYLAFQYIISAGGLRSEDDMPYCAGIPYGKDGNCMPCMADGYDKQLCGNYDDDDGGIPLYCEADTTLGQGSEALCKSDDGFAITISDWAAVSEDETEIAQQLQTVGPLSVALNAQRLQFYKGGVFNPSSCNPDNLDHAVLLVGYGTDSGDDYWTVKNSWGDSWGEDGYFRIERGSGTCGINTQVTTGVL